jgi:hypothetical protein
MIDIENAYKNETRDIAFFKIDSAAKVTIPEPDDAKLQAYYNDNKASFMTPEYRKYNVLVAMASDLKKDVVVTDEELKASYESEKETYDTPEKRRVQQIAFKDKAAAEAARDALVKGSKNFMDVAKDNGAKESDGSRRCSFASSKFHRGARARLRKPRRRCAKSSRPPKPRRCCRRRLTSLKRGATRARPRSRSRTN